MHTVINKNIFARFMIAEDGRIRRFRIIDKMNARSEFEMLLSFV